VASNEPETLGRVWVEDAFPGLAPSSVYHEVRRILSERRLVSRGRGDALRDHLLRGVRCEHPMRSGRVCAALAQPMYNHAREGTFSYASWKCSTGRGHRSYFPGSIDGVVLTLVLGAFDSTTLRLELDRIVRHDGAEHDQVRRLKRRVTDLEEQLDWDDTRARKARGKENVKRRDRYLRAYAKHERELSEAERALSDAKANWKRNAKLANGEYNKLMALSEDLPQLMEAAAKIPGRRREILHALIREVRGRRLAQGTYRVRVVLHSGAELRAIHLVDVVRYPQAVCHLAAERLGAFVTYDGRDTPDAEKKARRVARGLAAELNKVLSGPGGRNGEAWRPDHVLAAAYRATTLEATRDKASWITTDELGSRHPAFSKDLLAAALGDQLGPVRLAGGVLEVRDDPACLDAALPHLARTVLAERFGWDAEDLATVAEAARELGWRTKRVESYLDGIEPARPMLFDRAGNRHLHRSWFPPQDEATLAQLLETYRPVGQRGEWLSYPDARLRCPGANITTFRNHTVVVKPGYGAKGTGSVYIFVNEAVERAVRKPTLEEAIASSSLAHADPSDFVLREEILTQWQDRFGEPNLDRWRRAVAKGQAIEVRAQGPTSRRLRVYAYVPAAVRDTTEVDVVRDFLSRVDPG